MERAKIFVMELSRRINRRPSLLGKRPAFKSANRSAAARSLVRSRWRAHAIFSIGNILTRAMSEPGIISACRCAPLYWISRELRKISIKHKSAGPCHPIMARSVAPGRGVIGTKAGGRVSKREKERDREEGREDFVENNTANNTKQIAGATYRIYSYPGNWRACRTNELLCNFESTNDISFPYARIMKARYLLNTYIASATLQTAIKCIIRRSGGE